jgi:hypothetical protein
VGRSSAQRVTARDLPESCAPPTVGTVSGAKAPNVTMTNIRAFLRNMAPLRRRRDICRETGQGGCQQRRGVECSQNRVSHVWGAEAPSG